MLQNLSNKHFNKLKKEASIPAWWKGTITLALSAVNAFEADYKKLKIQQKESGDLLHLFWQRSSDACPLECEEAERQEREFKEWVTNRNKL